jgi:hypothetical protein
MLLPVSGMTVMFRAPDGRDDLAVLEETGGPVEQGLTLLERMAQVQSGDDDEMELNPGNAPRWRDFTVTDFEAALLGLRRFLFGDKAGCVFRAAGHKCGVPMELEFSIASFLGELRPGMPRRVEPSSEYPGWFAVTGGNDDAGLRFRLPVVDDQLKAMGHPDGAALLAQQCIHADRLDARARTRVERAMEAMAPPVSRPITGDCPDCGESLTMMLHVPRLVADEMRQSATGVHEEIHEIAAAYHWEEAAILAIPQSRRHAYVAAIRRQAREGV